jgi:hypothetical protein
VTIADLIIDHGGSTAPRGALHLSVVRGGQLEEIDLGVSVPPAEVLGVRELLAEATPRRSDPAEVRAWKRANLPNILSGLAKLAAMRAASRLTGIVHPEGILRLAKVSGSDGTITNYGLASVRVVTDVGCQKIVAVMNTSDATTAVNFKYHGLGTGTTAEASTDTALVAELTTEYATDNTRPTGSQTTGATTKVYRTAATITLDSGTPAITEHGVFHQAANSGGSLLDRSKFTAVNLDGTSGDSMIATYDFTMVSGS